MLWSKKSDIATDKAAAAKDAKDAEGKPTKAKPKHQEGVRDTVESILFALVLAFLFRTFEAEAFVIPTGSMAPTLYGRHKETNCATCGFHIAVGASDEVNPETGHLVPNTRLKSAICQNCGADNPQLFDELAFNGDRILVNKYPYEFGDPTRWDVFVFKFPEEPDVNYIKRLVGLPGETVRIRSGNIYLWDGERETIQRKDPFKQKTIQIPVYDDRHAPTQLLEAGWPERWAGVKPSTDVKAIGGWQDDSPGWATNAASRSYTISAEAAQQERWLRYRHLLPDDGDWENIEAGAKVTPRARIIGDFCGYNAYRGGHAPVQVDRGMYWVPDLTLNCRVNVQSVSDGGRLTLELTEGIYRYRCRIDVATGEAVLEEVNDQLGGRVAELAKATSSLKGTGIHELAFANVDDRLCLWVDNSLVKFGDGANLSVAGATASRVPTESDLCPVGVSVQGLSATVSDLVIERDIHYRANLNSGLFEDKLAENVYDPLNWADVYQRQGDELDYFEIAIPEDHYLALGDNSPRSRDSRLWDEGLRTVPREFLVGKAFWIYWPHGVPFLNDGRGYSVVSHSQLDQRGLKAVKDYPKYTVPFYPQYWRMKRIR